MKWIKLDPITRKRLERFRRIKRGYYSFLILSVALVDSRENGSVPSDQTGVLPLLGREQSPFRVV